MKVKFFEWKRLILDCLTKRSSRLGSVNPLKNYDFYSFFLESKTKNEAKLASENKIFPNFHIFFPSIVFSERFLRMKIKFDQILKPVENLVFRQIRGAPRFL